MEVKKFIKTIKTGEIFFKAKEKLSVIFIKNKIIKNKQLEYREYKRLKRKYSKFINNVEEDAKTELSNKVWILWFQGEKQAPDLIKACIKSIRDKFKDKEVIVLDSKSYKKYVTFPDYIEKKFKEGTIPYAHFSDLIRIALLAQHGGIWCDATLFITEKLPPYMIETDLFVFKNISLDREDEDSIVASSWFISSKSNNKIIVATRDMLYEYWKKRKFLTHYFTFHMFFKIAANHYKSDWEKIPTFNNISPHILQFELLNEFDEERFEQIKQMSPVHKLNRHMKNTDKNTFYNYIEKTK